MKIDLNPYLFNFFQVQNVQFNNTVFDGSVNLGFVNFTGLMINFQLFYSLQITNSIFSNSKQDIPVILVTYGKNVDIKNIVVKQIESLQFIQISLIDQLTLVNLQFTQINTLSVQDVIENPIQNYLDPTFNSLQGQSDKYLLNLGGIDTTNLSNLTISYCYNVALLNLNYFEVGLNTIQNSNTFYANNINITNLHSNVQEPAINLGNKLSTIKKLIDCKNLQVIDTLFTENSAFGDGGAIYLYKIQQSLIQNTNFVLNQALENSGGAIFSSNSKIYINNCIFKNNVSKKERGGAIYSDNSYLKIQFTNIIHNIAYIGGGIYYNQINSLKIDKFSQIYENKGKFYGNNLGSYPKKLLKVNHQTKQVYNKIIIKNFQSGNYTKQPIYVQFFDEQNEMLNFNIADQINQFSPSIKEELENYKISIANSSEITNLTIILGQELQYIKTINLFQLNITAGNFKTTDFQLILISQFFGQQLIIDLDLNFRKCQIGEVLYPKQGYISCDQCMPGTYSLADPNQGISSFLVQCQKCSNIYAKQCYSNQIILQDNYWRESKLTDIIYLCEMLGCSETNQNQINGCIQGYIGPLCNSCDYKGIYWGVNYAQKGKECYECGKIVQLYFYLAIIIGFYTFYIVISVNSQIQSNILIIKIEYLRKMEILFLSKTKLRGFQTGIILKIFFHYLQIFSSSIDIYNYIPDFIGNFYKLGGDPSQITYTNLDCIYKDWVISQLWFNRLVMQIAQIVFIVGLVLSSRYLLSRNIQRFYKIKTYFIFIYFFYYSSIVKLLVSLCVCKKVGTYYYMLNDHLQKCWTYEHALFQIGMVYPLTIIWSIVIPLILNDKIKSALQKKKQNNIKFIQTYYFIFQGYKQKFYYWEILKMFQRFIIMIILNLDIQAIIQRQLILFICFIFLKITIQQNPYQQKQSQNLEVLLQTMTLITLILQTLVYVLEAQYYRRLVLIIIIIILNFYNLLKIIFEYYRSALDLILKSQNQKAKKLIHFLFKLKIISFDIKKNQIQLQRISHFWKKLYSNRKILVNSMYLNYYQRSNSKS
ncbi:transmembrane protein, putative (macronuclear) [Tetrahymena thermophila SB210]|uniref:Transmembrane protein, putative n=1 Tax=Tetrahymena thermophila (strain SB210) TaxID=312017 RepID=Q23AU1_TETTS|nr:transmembrane protein, putative [Tetrahymena thermophila SB210]EAR93601.2 transmembrane protein, putative [Tetrahymena thermophila SB210]|eukprot:XP_001013846.2 transmembrane protein, putative [Tetrahymena thermophila SB210]